jgi:hypothetical protein
VVATLKQPLEGPFDAASAPRADLREKLDQLLKSGWSIQALKAYAFCWWRHRRCDHVTEGAWRWAVAFADATQAMGGRNLLERFKADPEHYSFVK